MIPNIIHFIFGLKEDFGGKPFSFVHYLAVKSAYDCNRPDAIKFYYKYEPSGEWWEKSKQYLTLIKVEPPTEIFGNKLERFAHQADVLRLEILLKEGGIYLDLDVICLNSFKPLLKYDCVMGKEGNKGLCNAIILAKPNAQFLNLWYEEYRSFNLNNVYSHHAVIVPGKIKDKNPDKIHVEDEYSFFWPLYRNASPLWEERRSPSLAPKKIGHALEAIMLSQSYAIHLWESLWWDEYLKHLTPKSIQTTNNFFSRICRSFFERSEDELIVPPSNNKFRHMIVPFFSLALKVREMKALRAKSK